MYNTILSDTRQALSANHEYNRQQRELARIQKAEAGYTDPGTRDIIGIGVFLALMTVLAGCVKLFQFAAGIL